MTKKDLKVGMVVEVKGDEGTNLAMICECGYCGLCVSSDNVYYPLSCVADDLRYGSDVITKVYGHAYNTFQAYKLSTAGRKLLWERPTLYNGKVVCVALNGTTDNLYTVGKIYTFKGGYCVADDGSKRPMFDKPIESIEDLNKKAIVDFIEVVE